MCDAAAGDASEHVHVTRARKQAHTGGKAWRCDVACSLPADHNWRHVRMPELPIIVSVFV